MGTNKEAGSIRSDVVNAMQSALDGAILTAIQHERQRIIEILRRETIGNDELFFKLEGKINNG